MFDGHDMDHYADDLAAVVNHLDFRDSVHVGHSTGGGEVVHYLARHGAGPRVARRADRRRPADHGQERRQPGGHAEGGLRRLPVRNSPPRSEFYREIAAGPFYGFNREGREPSEAIIENWWRQGMMGGIKAH